MAIIKIGFAQNIENFSAFCKAIRFGTSSPKTKVKNDNKIVTTTIAIVEPYGIFQEVNTLPNRNEIPVAALAELKNPAKVIAIWIVDKKFVGSCNKCSTNFAFRFPSSAKR